MAINSDTLSGEGKDLGGKVKETAGDVTGDSSLQGEGLVDQVTGKFQKAFGNARDGAHPVAERAGVLGVALINTLRGKR